MGTRKPATTAQIVEILRKIGALQNGHAVQYAFAVATLRRELHTNTRKAGEWLTLATADERRDFELIGTSGGRIRYVARGGADVLLNKAGYTDEPDELLWPQLTWQGEPVSKDADAGDREFIVFSNDLRAMCEHAAAFSKRKRMVRQRLQDSARDGAEERHGDALAHFRGLLKMAGIEVSARTLSASYHESITGGFTALNLTIMDGSIDAVGNVLAAHGIEPDPSTQIITRKPLREASNDS